MLVEEAFSPKITFNKDYYILMGQYNQFNQFLASNVGVGVGTVAGMTSVLIAGTLLSGGMSLFAYASGGVVGAIFGKNLFSLYGEFLTEQQDKKVTNAQIIGVAVEGESGKKYLTPTIIEADSAQLGALNCKEIVTIG